MRKDNLLCLNLNMAWGPNKTHQSAWGLWRTMIPLLQFTGPLLQSAQLRNLFIVKSTSHLIRNLSSVSHALLVESILNSATPLGFRDSGRTKCFSEGWWWTPKLTLPCLFLFYWVCQQHSTLLSCETGYGKVYFQVSNAIFLLVCFRETCVFMYLLWSTWIRNDWSI